MDKIRYYLCKTFIMFGGKIDLDFNKDEPEKSLITVDFVDDNEIAIDKLYKKIIEMKDKYPLLFNKIISILILDNLEGLNSFDEFDDDIDKEEFLNYFDNGLDMEDYDEDYNITPEGIVLILIDRAKDIENLSNLFVEYQDKIQNAVKYLLFSTIESTIEGYTELMHMTNLSYPENLKILTKYQSKEEFNSYYYKALNTASSKDSKLNFITFIREHYRFHKKKSGKEKGIKTAYNTHLFLLKYFGTNLGDKYFYEMGRNLYISIKRSELRNRINYDDINIINQLENPAYKIDDLKTDLVSNDSSVPELFKYFLEFSKDEDYESLRSSKKLRKELNSYVDEFDKKFEDLSKQKTK